MSATPIKTSTVWQLLDAQWIDTDPMVSVIATTVRGNGTEYAVVCSGPKGMKSNEFISAIRVAVAGLLRAGGGDMSVVGCGEVSDPRFDTGDQRAN
jgi:hypothetical protein